MLTIVGSAIIANIKDAFKAFVPLEISISKSFAAIHKTAIDAAHGNMIFTSFFAVDSFSPKNLELKNLNLNITFYII